MALTVFDPSLIFIWFRTVGYFSEACLMDIANLKNKTHQLSLNWTTFFRFVSCLLFCPSRAYHLLGRRVLAVKVSSPPALVTELFNSTSSGLQLYFVFSLRVSSQVIPLDITVELQKQIMSELEILYKVSIVWVFVTHRSSLWRNHTSRSWSLTSSHTMEAKDQPYVNIQAPHMV